MKSIFGYVPRFGCIPRDSRVCETIQESLGSLPESDAPDLTVLPGTDPRRRRLLFNHRAKCPGSDGMEPSHARTSLVIPLQNEEASARELLESLARQTHLPDEVVVVDAGSTDETAAIVRKTPVPFPLVLLSCGRLNPGEARNVGVAQAKHGWIGFVDGGIRAEPGWLAELLRVATSCDCEVVFGSYEPVCDSFFRECAAMCYVAPYGEWGGRGASVVGMLIRREAFAKVGGFAPFRAAEDLIFLEKIARLGLRTAYAARAVAHWQIAGGWRSTFRRFALYSHHNLEAGRGRHWHWGVARQYLAVACLALTAVLSGWRSVAVALVPAWLVARAAHSAWRKRRSFGFNTLAPGRILMAVPILLTIDLATAVGALRWVVSSERSRS
jgi:GT2 family glycosyltransferase